MKTEDIDSSNVSLHNYMKGIELMGRVVFVMDGEEPDILRDDWHWVYGYPGTSSTWSVSREVPFGMCLPQQLVHPSFGHPEVKRAVFDEAWKIASERLRMETKARLPDESKCFESGEVSTCRVMRAVQGQI